MLLPLLMLFYKTNCSSDLLLIGSQWLMLTKPSFSSASRFEPALSRASTPADPPSEWDALLPSLQLVAPPHVQHDGTTLDVLEHCYGFRVCEALQSSTVHSHDLVPYTHTLRIRQSNKYSRRAMLTQHLTTIYNFLPHDSKQYLQQVQLSCCILILITFDSLYIE